MNTYLITITSYGAHVASGNPNDPLAGPWYTRPGVSGLQLALGAIGKRPHAIVDVEPLGVPVGLVQMEYAGGRFS